MQHLPPISPFSNSRRYHTLNFLIMLLISRSVAVSDSRRGNCDLEYIYILPVCLPACLLACVSFLQQWSCRKSEPGRRRDEESNETGTGSSRLRRLSVKKSIDYRSWEGMKCRTEWSRRKAWSLAFRVIHTCSRDRQTYASSWIDRIGLRTARQTRKNKGWWGLKHRDDWFVFVMFGRRGLNLRLRKQS